MITLIIIGILLILVALLLILVVVLQNPKDEGGNIMSSNDAMKHLVGTAQVPHLLHKVTYWLFTAFALLTLCLSYLLGSYYGASSS